MMTNTESKVRYSCGHMICDKDIEIIETLKNIKSILTLSNCDSTDSLVVVTFYQGIRMPMLNNLRIKQLTFIY